MYNISFNLIEKLTPSPQELAQQKAEINKMMKLQLRKEDELVK